MTDKEKEIITDINDPLYTVDGLKQWLNRNDNVFINAPAALQAAHAKGFYEAVRKMAAKKQKSTLKDAFYTSVWDDNISIRSACKVNMETKQVYGINAVDIRGVDTLIDEYVTIDEKDYSVARKEEREEEDYYYE